MKKSGEIRRFLRWYFFVLFLSEVADSFFYATYVLFLINRGLNLLEVNIVNACFMITVFLFEMPTGAFADNKGRRNSFLVSCIIRALAMLIYYLSGYFWQFIVAEIFCGISTSFASGAFQAWLIGNLNHFKLGRLSKKMIIKTSQIIKLAAIIGSIAGAYTAKINLATPWLIAAFGNILSALLVYLFVKDDYTPVNHLPDIGLIKKIKTTIRESVAFGIGNRKIFFLINLGAALSFAMQSMNMYWAPLFNGFLKDVKWMGWIFTSFMLITIFGNFLAGYLTKKSERKWPVLIISLLITSVFVILASAVNGFALILFFFVLHECSRGVFYPIQSTLINENIKEEKVRATVLSFESMMCTLASFLGLTIGGLIAKYISIQASWCFSGLFLLISIVFIYSRKYKKRHGRYVSQS